MAKTSKFLPQKVAYTSRLTAEINETAPDVVDLKRSAANVATDEPAAEPPLKKFIPGGLFGS